MKRALVTLILLPALAFAGTPEFSLIIKNHQFSPAEVKVPSDTKIMLVVYNMDSTPEEFESHALNREKLISGKSKATIYVGPLKPGNYAFFGEFHEPTARGVVVAE